MYANTMTDSAKLYVSPKALLLSMAAFGAVLMMTSPVYAGGAWTPMGDVLCYVASMFYGNLGRGLATLAVIVVGVGATLGKVSWGLAITVAVGIAVVFNAHDVMSRLTGNSSACNA